MTTTDVLDRIDLVRGDITKQPVDAIVNAANETLLGGGGVDGAIHRAAGPELLEECRTLGGCPTGSARITAGYRLPARYVIHTVGPVYGSGGPAKADLLASCYRTSLELAAGHGCRTVAFPAISCGVYGYPLPEAAEVSIRAVGEFLHTHELPERVQWVLFDAAANEAYEQALRRARGRG
jgi:O-acetyl-ADP-ribose deacetylase (regulator of RNase III)